MSSFKQSLSIKSPNFKGSRPTPSISISLFTPRVQWSHHAVPLPSELNTPVIKTNVVCKSVGRDVPTSRPAGRHVPMGLHLKGPHSVDRPRLRRRKAMESPLDIHRLSERGGDIIYSPSRTLLYPSINEIKYTGSYLCKQYCRVQKKEGSL